MWIRTLRVDGVRCLREVALSPVSGLNVLTGENGAGKTSVLESIALLAGGKSFRTSRVDPVVSRARGGFEVFAEVEGTQGTQRLGIARAGSSWSLRVNGVDGQRMGSLSERLAALFFEPDSHELLAGGSEGRRRFLDWGVFHVERGFAALWGRYQRALRQRNALLRQSQLEPSLLGPWDRELVEAGEPLSAAREHFLRLFVPVLRHWCNRLAAELGEPQFRLQRGWSEGSLADDLGVSADRDRALGYTNRGPHRADWSLRFAVVGGRDELSRGQLKLACFALSRAMLDLYAQLRGEAPVACLDDLFSELDAEHQQRCLRALDGAGVQVWVTGTETRPALDAWSGERRLFHVEHGQVQVIAP